MYVIIRESGRVTFNGRLSDWARTPEYQDQRLRNLASESLLGERVAYGGAEFSADVSVAVCAMPFDCEGK